MKKVWLAAALLGLVTMAASSFAEVQNIRLSGDLRVRGYYLNGLNGNGNVNQEDNAFIRQRTRVTVEADLEDHVLVVVTLKAEGQWGDESSSPYNRDRGWSVVITEAYVQLSEMFFSPATLKLGRQYLHYGRGLHVSSANETYNFDAGRLVLDFYPFTLDVVGARLTDNNSGPTANTGNGGNNLLFINGRYEMKDSIIKDVEAYFGWLSRGSAGGANLGYYYPNINNASPWIIGLRTDLTPIKGLDMWAEATYEGGADGTSSSKTLSAWLANVGAKYTFKDVKMEPSINANYIYASGGAAGKPFVPFFASVENYNGYIFCPILSNIHIMNLGASIKPAKNTTVSVQGYYYMKADNDGSIGTDYYQREFSGGFTGWSSNANKHEAAWEIDGIVGYDYSKDVRFQLVYGMFIPERNYTDNSQTTDSVGQMVRGEVNVKF